MYLASSEALVFHPFFYTIRFLKSHRSLKRCVKTDFLTDKFNKLKI